MIKAIRSFIKKHLTSRTLRNIALVYLLFVMLVNVLRDSIQGVENSLLMLMIAVGLLLGWSLAISDVSSWKTALIAFISGGTILTIRVGRLGTLISTLFGQIFDLGVQTFLGTIEEGGISRSTTIPVGIAELGTRILTLESRFWDLDSKSIPGKTNL